MLRIKRRKIIKFIRWANGAHLPFCPKSSGSTLWWEYFIFHTRDESWPSAGARPQQLPPPSKLPSTPTFLPRSAQFRGAPIESFIGIWNFFLAWYIQFATVTEFFRVDSLEEEQFIRTFSFRKFKFFLLTLLFLQLMDWFRSFESVEEDSEKSQVYRGKESE